VSTAKPMRRIPLRAFELLFAVALATACSTPSVAPSAQPMPAGSWLTAAQRHIAQREYRPSENAQGLQAPNRAHNLRTYFAKDGIRVHDRSADGSPALLQISLARAGRGDTLSAVAPGEVAMAHETRVEIRHAGIVEWYVNSPAGLEQGFTLEARPEGDGPVVVELAVAGATPVQRGDAIVFETPTHRTLRYGQLHAVDATGRALGAHLEVSPGQSLRIVVDDSAATYPIAIDPLLTDSTPDTQLEGNQANAQIGFSVASAGDVNGDGFDDVIVGSQRYDDKGAVFIFLGSASGIANGDPSTAATQLDPDQPYDFGSVSVSGAGDVDGDGFDDVIIGAPGDGSGAALLFLGSASGIADGTSASASARLVPNPSSAGVESVAGAGDVNGDGYDDVIVGSPNYSGDQYYEGAAFLFLGSSSGIDGSNPATRLEGNLALVPGCPPCQLPPGFGRGVAGAGDVNGDGYDDVMVTATGQDENGETFVFHGSASGIANGGPAAAATRLDTAGSIAGAGDVDGDGYADVILGLPNYYIGWAYIFLGSAAGIPSGGTSSAATQLQGDREYEMFGWSVDGAGDVNDDGYADVIVGAPKYNCSECGRALVFTGSAIGIPSGTAATAAMDLSRPGAGKLGHAVAGAGDINGDGSADLIASDYLFEAGEQFEGAAFIFLGNDAISANGRATPDTELQSDEASARLGFDVASAGDVNGDEYDDVIVGAPYFDAGQTNEGAAFVFMGSASAIPDGSPATAATQIESDLAFANLGESVAGAGDVNGDGYDDVVVGDPNYGSGAAFVFLGSATGLADGNPATAAARLTAVPSEVCPDPASTGFGISVAGAGDVNDDGFGDLIVGAPWYLQASPCAPVSGPPQPGAAFVFLGSAAGIADATPATAATRLLGATPAWLGDSVSGAGDVNGDGFDDVIVGAPYYSATETDEGAAFVFLGSANGVLDGGPATAAAQLESNQPLAHMGSSVAGAGDVNGDSYADVIVGAPFYDRVTGIDSSDGAAFVFLGSASGIAAGSPLTAATKLVSNQAHSALGVSVTGAGDVDRDGYDDVVVGASQYEVDQVASGAAFLFLGSATGTSRHARASMEGSQNEERFGASVAGAGDVDGDGYADVIVGASGHDDGQSDEGAAFVYLPEPGLELSLAGGVVLLAGLRRRRSTGCARFAR
jgi:FG-GAP repeat protein/VCBS repeat protein